jgi:hypothetical protein
MHGFNITVGCREVDPIMAALWQHFAEQIACVKECKWGQMQTLKAKNLI